MAKTKKPRPNVWSKDYAPYGTTTKRGNSDQWRAAYEERMMGHDEAVAVLDDDNPYVILGIPQGSDKDTVKSAYRKLVMTECKDAFSLNPNPDVVERFKKIHAAYSILMN